MADNDKKKGQGKESDFSEKITDNTRFEKPKTETHPVLDTIPPPKDEPSDKGKK